MRIMSEVFILARENFGELLSALKNRGYQVIGPTVREGAIVYDELGSVEDLPIGWTDEQDGGIYRLTKREDNALFGYAVGPHSWKQFLHPPVVRLWQANRSGTSFQIERGKAHGAQKGISWRPRVRTGRHRRSGQGFPGRNLYGSVL